MPLRTAALLKIFSEVVSGFSTTPYALVSTSRTNSGRCTRMFSAMRRYLLFDLVGEQHVVNAVGKFFAVLADMIRAVTIEFCLDAARMRRQQQNPVADQHRLRNRVRDEKHREMCFVP